MNTRCILLGLSLMFPLVGSSSLDNCVSSPDHINFTMKSLQYFYLTWQPLKADVGCPVQYEASITSLSNNYAKVVEGPEPNVVLHGNHEIDLNSKLLFEVQTNFENENKSFSSMSRCLQLAPGDDRTAVRNFSCIWYEDEGVKCTWQPGEITPPDVKYKLLYWFPDERPKANRNYTLEEFWDLLETAKICQRYSFEGSFVGCTFTYEKNVEKRELKRVPILTVVIDESKKIKPFIYYSMYLKIVKLKPPTIYNGSRSPSNTIYVEWNSSQQTISEVELSGSSIDPERHMVKNSYYEFQDLSPKVTYTVCVRVKLSSSIFWSDWSEKKIFEGENYIVTLILLLLIPSLAVIAAIVLLIFIKRLKLYFCPKIPNPAIIFSGDTQAWIKSDVYNVHSKAKKEEVCPVYLLESSATKIQDNCLQ